MSSFNFTRSQASADRMIKRWGLASFLVRADVKRPCFAARQEYKPSEVGLFEIGTERFYISALNLPVPPDHEQDKLLFNGNLYSITQKPTGPRPNGMVMFYDCNVMLIGAAT